MPSKSIKQAKLMAEVAHDKDFAYKVGTPKKVGKEFNDADIGTGLYRKNLRKKLKVDRRKK